MVRYTNQDLSRKILQYYDPAIKIGNGEIYQYIAGWIDNQPEEINVYDKVMIFRKPLISVDGKVMKTQRLRLILFRATHPTGLYGVKSGKADNSGLENKLTT